MPSNSNLQAELDELRSELRALKAHLNLIPADPALREPNLPRGVFRDQMGILRKHTDGSVAAGAGIASYEDRQREAVAAANRAIDAAQAKAAEGLPVGYARDPFGLVRRVADGQLHVTHMREADGLERINRANAADHRAWKQSVGLPVRPIPTTDNEESE